MPSLCPCRKAQPEYQFHAAVLTGSNSQLVGQYLKQLDRSYSSVNISAFRTMDMVVPVVRQARPALLVNDVNQHHLELCRAAAAGGATTLPVFVDIPLTSVKGKTQAEFVKNLTEWIHNYELSIPSGLPGSIHTMKRDEVAKHIRSHVQDGALCAEIMQHMDAEYFPNGATEAKVRYLSSETPHLRVQGDDPAQAAQQIDAAMRNSTMKEAVAASLGGKEGSAHAVQARGPATSIERLGWDW
mmetsp:Transcript_57057/g.101926  ORF Transcript_57057/g.101926 Transcript_57057/m.101926 type:complete len:242 (-) Transcript_57057:97-822(-)